VTASGAKPFALPTERFPEPPPRSISLDGAPELPAHGESSLSSARGGDPQGDERGPLDPLAPLEYRLELTGAAEPHLARQRERLRAAGRHDRARP